MKELKLVEVKDERYYKREVYEIGSYCVMVDFDDDKLDEINIRQYDWRYKKYIPNIYHEKGKNGERFVINTAGYGTLNPSEIQEIIKGYQEAIEVVEVLTNTFIK